MTPKTSEAVRVPSVPTEAMIDCALRMLPNLPRVCMAVALEDAIAAGTLRESDGGGEVVAWMVADTGLSGQVYRSYFATKPPMDAYGEHARLIPLYAAAPPAAVPTFGELVTNVLTPKDAPPTPENFGDYLNPPPMADSSVSTVTLLRELCDQLNGVGCGPCVGSDAPMEDLHGRIARFLGRRPYKHCRHCDGTGQSDAGGECPCVTYELEAALRSAAPSGMVLVNEAQLVAITEGLDEHPEEWDGPCMCADCRSYAAEDAQ